VKPRSALNAARTAGEDCGRVREAVQHWHVLYRTLPAILCGMVKLTAEQEEQLQRLVRAANALEAAEASLQAALHAALALDVPRRRVAEAAGMHRSRLYRLIDRENQSEQTKVIPRRSK